MKTVVGVFSSSDSASRTVNQLRSQGFDKEISIVGKDEGGNRGRQGTHDTGMMNTGATTGGIVGGLAGLALAGAGAVAIPGIGPVLAAGPISALISGAAVGGIAGGLADWGIDDEEGRRYEEDVKRGHFLAIVRSNETNIDEAANTMRQHGADRVTTHE